MHSFPRLLVTAAFLALPHVRAAPVAPPTGAVPEEVTPRPATDSEQVVGYLNFFRKWDTPEDDAATRMFSRLLRQAPDFQSFQALAPQDSAERKLFERHLASFEEAGHLIRNGRMHEGMFFDAWYEMPNSWNRAKPYVQGMRIEANNMQLYSQFEWLAGRAEKFWAERERYPPKWQPITNGEPTAADKAIFAAFNQVWSTPRDKTAVAFLAELQRRATSYEEFSAIVKPASEEYIKFDRVLCAYDQAGALIKNGILHPKLFFEGWRRPAEIWAFTGPWVKGLRQTTKSEHLYENVDWLVKFEADRRGINGK